MQLKWMGKGTEKSPISIKALNPGKVKIEGGSTLRIAGEWISVDDYISQMDMLLKVL